MRLSHARRAISARFDDPNLVSCAGLAPVLAPAARCGLPASLTERLRIAARGGANATTKVLALVAGMIAGADSIDDMDLLRHGGMTRLFTHSRAPSTLGTFLRVFTFGHVRPLDAVAAQLLVRLTAATPILPSLSTVAFLDIDDTVRQTNGYAKQGAGRGYSGVKGLNALLATVSTPLSAPVIAAPGYGKARRTRCAARRNCWPTPWPPPSVPGPPGRSRCARTRRSTATRSSPPPAAPPPGSPSPPASPRP